MELSVNIKGFSRVDGVGGTGAEILLNIVLKDIDRAASYSIAEMVVAAIGGLITAVCSCTVGESVGLHKIELRANRATYTCTVTVFE